MRILKTIAFTLLIIFLLTAGICLSLPASAKECRYFTGEQSAILNAAYKYGLPHNYQYTLAAIAWQESFLGHYVIRSNGNDGEYGSHGVTHILLETAAHFDGVKLTKEYSEKEAGKLVIDNDYSFKRAVQKLDSVGNVGWLERWRLYNGRRDYKYAIKIKDNIRRLKKCDFFGGEK